MVGMHRRAFLGSSCGLAAWPAAAAIEAASGKPRLRSAICAYSFRSELQKKTMTYEDLIRLAADLDVDGLDLTVYWFPSTGDTFLLPLRRTAYRAGVEIYSISVRTEMCRPSADLRAREVEAVRGWVDVATKLGAGHIRVFGGTVPEGHSEEEAAGWVVEVLKQAAEYAASKGVILGLENHGGITSRAERIVDIIQRVDSPWVGVNLDTGNFREDPYRQIQMCIPYAVNVQMKETISANGRREKCDWPRIIGMLRSAGYKGYLALEYEEKEPAAAAVPRLMAELKRLIGR